jgi:hypothetical protein
MIGQSVLDLEVINNKHCVGLGAICVTRYRVHWRVLVNTLINMKSTT